MQYRRFEDLPAWQAAIDLAVGAFEFTGTESLRGYAGLRDQFERAAVSVSNNIAEGFERGTREELLTFLYIARGSAGEVRSMLCLLERIPDLRESISDIERLKSCATGISRQIGGWIESLKRSDNKGPRYETQETRRTKESTKRGEQFLNELRQIQNDRSGPEDEACVPDPPP